MGATDPDINPSPTPLGKSLSLKSGYEEWVQIEDINPSPTPFWEKSLGVKSGYEQGMRIVCISRRYQSLSYPKGKIRSMKANSEIDQGSELACM